MLFRSSKVEAALNIFHQLFENNKEFLKFIEDFDNYYANEESNQTENSFQDVVHNLKSRFVDIYNEGVNDGTISPIFDAEEKYDFIYQIMISATQKLSSNFGKIQGHDAEYSKKYISELISMFIKYIKN